VIVKMFKLSFCVFVWVSSFFSYFLSNEPEEDIHKHVMEVVLMLLNEYEQHHLYGTFVSVFFCLIRTFVK
jgi:hypothetical protein